MDTDVGQ